MWQDIASISTASFPFDEVYKDKGCSYHSTCLTCPFEDCRYDVPRGVNSAIAALERMTRAYELLDRGMNNKEIAAEMGIAERTVYRYLEMRK